MNTVHLTVSGIAGNESKTKIKNALDKIKGVQNIAVDISRGTVEVEFNSPASESSIKNCIENTGYEIE